MCSKYIMDKLYHLVRGAYRQKYVMYNIVICKYIVAEKVYFYDEHNGILHVESIWRNHNSLWYAINNMMDDQRKIPALESQG